MFGILAAKSEAGLRDDLAASCRLFASHAWANFLLHGQFLSLRLPAASASVVAFLINPPGMLLADVCASDLVRIDVLRLPDGQIDVRGLPSSDNVQAIELHVHLHLTHAASPELQCFFQAQTVPCAAVAAMSCGLLPICQASCFALQGGAIRWTVVDAARCPVSAVHKVVLSHAFGTITAGRAVAEAFHYMFYTANACEMQVGAAAAGLRHLSFPPTDIAITHFAVTMERFQQQGLGHAIFEALRRSLPPSYKL
ncbi:hypothetical protein SPRG_11903 [Saprolegnia parasitica CBS 223.65]|uniref:Class II aldolase/adducin N-terminal domain-containing protein n=1 Tax=Saprolegnia parasitica (strain CBS 223.65) TaxID=695850 RepID=A0A067C929_SAPPC|nr:hypothetical protein SPRG_11903 [Saprolegnia parasitica CBS 223.65]KDO23056.1 hypothetical protein SPRG_11903 [Saprolegnia parasitica CBS 223.65]|eukprot:XP_012206173.1 hypothetical protein SPRG_11903 [Saprolegnia parasitica CBS 223.65]